MVTVSATDDGTTGFTQFTWNVNDTTPPTLQNPGNQVTQVNTPVSLQLTSTEAAAFSDLVSSKDTLPPGLTVSNSGLISGTPTTGGSFSVTITDSPGSGTASTSVSFTWNVTLSNPPVLTYPAMETVTINGSPITPINPTMKSNVDAGSITDVVGGQHTLPPGLTVNSTTGQITGTLTSTDGNSYNATITGFEGATPVTANIAFTVNGSTSSNSVVDTVVLETNGAVVRFVDGVGTPQMLSGPGTVKAISTVYDATNHQTIVFAITTGAVGAQYNNNVWEFSFGAWSQQTDSQYQFQQISATTNSSGETLLFGVTIAGPGSVTGGSNALYEQTHSTGIDTGLTLISAAGSIKSVSAVTDSAGVDHAYAIVTADSSVWVHTPGSWVHLTPTAFTQVTAGLNTAGQAVVYGVVAGSGALVEQNPAIGAGFYTLSNTNGLPSSFLGVQAGGPGQVFAIAADKTVWEDGPTSGKHISLILTATQLSATQTPDGTDEVFMTLTDGSFWEYSLELPGSHFKELLTGGVASSSTPL